MKRHTVILPFLLPRRTDQAAAQLVALLSELLAGVAHHYAPRVHRYHQRQRARRPPPITPPAQRVDSPF